MAEEFNHLHGESIGVHLKVIRWETDSYPGFHPQGPQGLIDPILNIENADIVIGIFWKRFGLPISTGETGTEHEIRRAIQAWKATGLPQIMLYFSGRPYAPQSKDETDQWGMVLQFRKELEKAGEAFYWGYMEPSDFKDHLRKHMTKYLLQRYGAPKAAPASKTPSAYEWHPPHDVANRGELTECWFTINSNYKDDGEGRWNRWGDVLVNLENAPNSDEVYLVPNRKAPGKFQSPKKLMASKGPLRRKKEITEDFVKRHAGQRLKGLQFEKLIFKEGKKRIHVYSAEYDEFLNQAASLAAAAE